MPIWTHYHIAHSLPDALGALASSSGESRIIAGGTDLLLDLQQGRHPPIHTIVDVSQIPELGVIELVRGKLSIGAAVPLNCIITSPIVKLHAEALIDAACLIGGPQVRNIATLGGNVAHALPAADGTIALLALEAQAEIARSDSTKMVPIEDLFLGPGKSALDPKQEILVGFHIPIIRTGQASAFRRVMRPQGVAIAILNLGVWLERQQGTITDIRISCGPSSPRPVRLRATESVFRGRQLNKTIQDEGMKSLLNEARFRTSPHRSTEEYRRHLAGILLQETIEIAWSRAA